MLEAAGEGTKMADHFSPIFRPRLSSSAIISERSSPSRVCFAAILVPFFAATDTRAVSAQLPRLHQISWLVRDGSPSSMRSINSRRFESSNTRAAVSNEIPCFARLAWFLLSSHSNVTLQLYGISAYKSTELPYSGQVFSADGFEGLPVRATIITPGCSRKE